MGRHHGHVGTVELLRKFPTALHRDALTVKYDENSIWCVFSGAPFYFSPISEHSRGLRGTAGARGCDVRNMTSGRLAERD